MVVARFAAVAAAALAGAAAAQLPYDTWAHSHMVWLDNSRSNQTACTAYVADYFAHNITVGGLDIDSGWSTGYNNFIIDTNKFANMTQLVNQMHAQGVNVILWMTSMIDTDSSNFNVSLANGYGIRNAVNQTAMLDWWHGTGMLLDYGNPAAQAWWNNQLDGVLATGIDGWKVDGTDPYINECLAPLSIAGYIDYRVYADWYYGYTFNHTRETNGPHCLIWSRPVDSYPLVLNLSAFIEFSPKYVMASGWVGDQDPDWYGLKMALINLLESGWQQYANFGSDTGGYRSGSTRTGELLIRWAQVNAFLPLFENGGNDEHRPWGYDAPGSTYYTDIYRRLVAAHYELGPFLYATGTEAILNGTSSIAPQAAPPVDFPFLVQPDMLNDTDYGYSLGGSMFVSPIVDANVTEWPVTLPTGNGAAGNTWYEYWNASATHVSGVPFLANVPLTVSAAFVQTGAILPMHVSTHLGGVHVGDESWASAVTLSVHSPVDTTSAGGPITARLYDWPDVSADVSYVFDASAGRLVLSVAPFTRDVILLLRGVAVVEETTAAAAAAASVQVMRGDGKAAQALARVEAPVPPPSSYTPRPLSWAECGAGARLPVAVAADATTTIADHVAAAAAPLAGTWSYSPDAGGMLIARLGPSATGITAVVNGVSLL